MAVNSENNSLKNNCQRFDPKRLWSQTIKSAKTADSKKIKAQKEIWIPKMFWSEHLSQKYGYQKNINLLS